MPVNPKVTATELERKVEVLEIIALQMGTKILKPEAEVKHIKCINNRNEKLNIPHGSEIDGKEQTKDNKLRIIKFKT